MKRFTETLKWDDPWFRALPGHVKLGFLYIIDRCDNAGFWEVDLDGMEFQTKLSRVHCEGALKGLERGIKEASGWVWVRNFLRHQKNDRLNSDNPAHKQIISLVVNQLERFPECKTLLPKGATKGLQSPIGKGIGKGRGKSTPEEEELMIRVGKILGRRSSTKWTDEEAEAFRGILPIDPEDLGLLEEFYAAVIPSDSDHRRTSIARLLKYWNGELDKARVWKSTH